MQPRAVHQPAFLLQVIRLLALRTWLPSPRTDAPHADTPAAASGHALMRITSCSTCLEPRMAAGGFHAQTSVQSQTAGNCRQPVHVPAKPSQARPSATCHGRHKRAALAFTPLLPAPRAHVGGACKDGHLQLLLLLWRRRHGSSANAVILLTQCAGANWCEVLQRSDANVIKPPFIWISTILVSCHPCML